MEQITWNTGVSLIIDTFKKSQLFIYQYSSPTEYEYEQEDSPQIFFSKFIQMYSVDVITLLISAEIEDGVQFCVFIINGDWVNLGSGMKAYGQKETT